MASERQPQDGETSSVIAASHGAWLDSWQCWNNRATPTSRACNQWATAWAPTLAFETHDTNARRLTLTSETRDANAQPQRPKTGPFTPAKATPVSRKTEEHNPRHQCEAPNTHPRMKPTTPMRGPAHTRMKPTTPMHGPRGPKQAHSHPQRRHRFHNPHQPPPQRRYRFHERPKNTTHTTTRPPTPIPATYPQV